MLRQLVEIPRTGNFRRQCLLEARPCLLEKHAVLKNTCSVNRPANLGQFVRDAVKSGCQLIARGDVGTLRQDSNAAAFEQSYGLEDTFGGCASSNKREIARTAISHPIRHKQAETT